MFYPGSWWIGWYSVIPEYQCRFSAEQITMDMISICQFMEKCVERWVPLYQVFVDITKAFTTVNRCLMGYNGEAQISRDFWAASSQQECNSGGKWCETRQHILFSIYFAVVFVYTFQNCDIGVYVHFRISGNL